MKKVKKIWIFSILALVVAAALSAGVVTQLVRPVSVKQVCVSIEPLHVGTFPGQKSTYNRMKKAQLTSDEEFQKLVKQYGGNE